MRRGFRDPRPCLTRSEFSWGSDKRKASRLANGNAEGTHYLIRQRGHWLWAPVGGRPALALGDRDAVAGASGEGVDGGGRRKGGRGREGKGRRGSSWKRDLHFVRSCEFL